MTRLSMTAVALICTLTAPAGATCDQIDPLILIPGNEACPGIVLDGEPQTAYTYDELYEIINGGAEVYINYGFVAAAFQNYLVDIIGEPVPGTLSVFNQGTAENAEALYDDPASGGGDAIPDWPGTGDARVQIFLFATRLQFWEACLFVSFEVASTEAEAYDAARCIGERILESIHGAVPVQTQSWGRLKTRYR